MNPNSIDFHQYNTSFGRFNSKNEGVLGTYFQSSIYYIRVYWPRGPIGLHRAAAACMRQIEFVARKVYSRLGTCLTSITEFASQCYISNMLNRNGQSEGCGLPYITSTIASIIIIIILLQRCV